MVVRLVLKFAFKACLPVLAMVGIMSYMYYLQGGDPKAVLTKVTGGIFGQARDSMNQAGRSLDSISLDSLKPGGESSVREVHTWVDANGVTHYEYTAPAGVESRTMRVNANANVVASVPKPEPKKRKQEKVADNQSSTSNDATPSAGGVNLPVNLNREELTKFLEDSQRPSVERYGLD